MKLLRVLFAALLFAAAAACSEPTAPGVPSVPLPDLDPSESNLTVPIP